MANWYDNGITSTNGIYGTSTSVTNREQCGSFTCPESDVAGSKTIMLFALANGTQVWYEIKWTHIDGVYCSYNPYSDVWLGLNSYQGRVTLKNGNRTTVATTDYYGIGDCVTSPLLDYDLVNLRNYSFWDWDNVNAGDTFLNNSVDSNGVTIQIYPNKGMSRNSGTNCQYFFIANDDGLYINMMDSPYLYIGTYEEIIPYHTIGFIPKTLLDDAEWFDPNTARVNPEDLPSKGGSGKRHVDRNYNGQDIDFPNLPSGANALAFGRMKIFNPNDTQLGSALDILWSDSSESTLETIIESCKKWWYKPEQYCTSLMLTPVDCSTVASSNIYFGKYNTNVSAPVVNNQWQIVDCGTLSVPLMYGSYLDYDLTSALLYLPYIGFRNINAKECIGGTIAIKYYIDILTGSGLCMVKCVNDNCNNSVLYTYECNVNVQIPLTSNNYNNVIGNLLHSSMAVGGAIASGNVGLAVGTLASSSINTATDMQPNILQSGQLTPNTGVLGNEKPYIVIHFPVSVENYQYTNINGKRSDSVGVVSDYKGYTEFNNIYLDGINLPYEIKQEIENICKSGVIL